MNELDRRLEDLSYGYHEWNELSIDEQGELAEMLLLEKPEIAIQDDSIYDEKFTLMLMDIFKNGDENREKFYELKNYVRSKMIEQCEYEIRNRLEDFISMRAADDPYIAEERYHQRPDVEYHVWR